jgi:hypothetical protein
MPLAAATDTQQQGDEGLTLPPAAITLGGGQLPPPPPPPHQLGVGVNGGGQQAPGIVAYSRIDSALHQSGHTMYDPVTNNAKLSVQSGVNPGDVASQMGFQDFVVNIQQFSIYLAMLRGQPYVSMIHTPGVYYSIISATNTFQGIVLAFIGDCRATKEPTLVCLPTTKSWDWHMGDASTDVTKLDKYYAMEVYRGALWMPGAGNGAPATTKVPNLLAIPNALVNLLCTQGPAIMPHNMLATINKFVQSSRNPTGQQWECVCKWCLVVSQAGANGKSKVRLDTSPITIDNKFFDQWVGNQLDISVEPHPLVSTVVLTGRAGNEQAIDYLALSKMLATTIGSNMIQFSQAIIPQVGATGTTGGKTALATGKRFDQDQIRKLKDACCICNAQKIPPILSVIQASKEITGYFV